MEGEVRCRCNRKNADLELSIFTLIFSNMFSLALKYCFLSCSNCCLCNGNSFFLLNDLYSFLLFILCLSLCVLHHLFSREVLVLSFRAALEVCLTILHLSISRICYPLCSR